MKAKLVVLAALWPLLLPAASVAQRATVGATGVANGQPAEYSILFRERSFDLSVYRAAVRGQVDADLALAELDASMRADQADFVSFVEDLGVRVTHQWWLVNGCAVIATPAQLAAIRAHPRVLDIQADVPRRPGEYLIDAKNDLNSNADAVHSLGIKGRGVTIASIDSGVDEYAQNRFRPHAAFYPGGNPNNRTGRGIAGSRLLANVQVGKLPADNPIGHGTAVAGAAVAGRWNTTATSSEGIAPEADLVSYSVVDLPSGLAHQATMASAWQRVAADRLRYGIRVVNCSYFGVSDPIRVDAQAIDALGYNADVVITGMAGNLPSAPLFRYGSTNMLAVGATETNTREVASFSAKGPFFLARSRFYPHLVANGVNVVLPLADVESGNRISRGTSYSAPQVAAAAALYISQKPIAPATEVNAAILATTQDVSAANPNGSRNSYGAGYLRIDALVGLARNPSGAVVTTSTLTPQRKTLSFPLSVRQGQRYAVAMTWFRKDTTKSFGWSNLDFQVRLNGQILADGNSPANAYEIARFTAPATGTATIRVDARSLEPNLLFQRFSLVAVEATLPYVPVTVRDFGQDCGTKIVLGADPMPYPGRSYEFELRNAQPQAVPILALGLSDRAFGGISLPASLTTSGAPGCSLYVSVDLTLPVTASNRRLSIHLPSTSAIVGGTIFHQMVVFEPGNALGLKTTNAFAIRVGG